MCVIEPSPVVETRRLSLRSPGAQDISRLATLANDVDVARMTLRMPHPFGIADAEALCASGGGAGPRPRAHLPDRA